MNIRARDELRNDAAGDLDDSCRLARYGIAVIADRRDGIIRLIFCVDMAQNTPAVSDRARSCGFRHLTRNSVGDLFPR